MQLRQPKRRVRFLVLRVGKRETSQIKMKLWPEKKKEAGEKERDVFIGAGGIALFICC